MPRLGVVQLLEEDHHPYEQPFGTLDLQDLRDLDILADPQQPQQHLNTIPVVDINHKILQLLSHVFVVLLPQAAHAAGPDAVPQAGHDDIHINTPDHTSAITLKSGCFLWPLL